jgi:hypothetical protein
MDGRGRSLRIAAALPSLDSLGRAVRGATVGGRSMTGRSRVDAFVGLAQLARLPVTPVSPQRRCHGTPADGARRHADPVRAGGLTGRRLTS